MSTGPDRASGPSLAPEARPNAPRGAGAWLRARPAAAASLALGVLAIVIAFAMQLRQDALFELHPDARVTLPFFAAALIATIASLVRRERAYAPAIGGLGLAAAALALGWILAAAIVAAVAGVLIYILSEVL